MKNFYFLLSYSQKNRTVCKVSAHLVGMSGNGLIFEFDIYTLTQIAIRLKASTLIIDELLSE